MIKEKILMIVKKHPRYSSVSSIEFESFISKLDEVIYLYSNTLIRSKIGNNVLYSMYDYDYIDPITSFELDKLLSKYSYFLFEFFEQCYLEDLVTKSKLFQAYKKFFEQYNNNDEL